MHNADIYSPNMATLVSLLEVGRGWVISMASFSRLCLNSKSNMHTFISTYIAILTYSLICQSLTHKIVDKL